MPTIKKGVAAVLLTQKGDIKAVELGIDAISQATSLQHIQAALKKGAKAAEPEVLGHYKTKQFTLFLLGYTKGKAGQENQHELPPPHDSGIIFGDILALASKDTKSWSKPTPFQPTDYETFYTKAFGGFEELDEGDEEEDGAEEAGVDEEVDAEAEAEAEEEEEEAEDEEDEEDDEAVEDVEAADDEEEQRPRPIPIPKPKKARKITQATAAATSLAAYTTYLHVDPAKELTADDGTGGSAEDITPRRRVVKAARELLKNVLDEAQILQLERAIYNGAIRIATQRHVGKTWSHPPFVEMYNMYAKHIISNFNPNSYVGNTEMFERFQKGTLSFDQLPQMNTYEVFEGRWKEHFIQQQLREKRQLEGNKAMATDRFLCTRCWKRECTYYEMQTRSADEPMTIFITCLNCGKHWRQ